MQLNAKKTKVMCFLGGNHLGPQCQETTTKSPGSANVASIISHPFHVPRPYRTLRHTYFSHTSARGKSVRLPGSQTRPHDDHESCSGIHVGKGQQRPFSGPRCLIFPPLRQAPLQPYLLQFACPNAQHVEIMRPSTLPTIPPLHLRRFPGSNVAGHPQQVTQHHTACLWALNSSTC